MNGSRIAAFVLVSVGAGPAVAANSADPDQSRLDLVEVTATRFRESVQEVPDAMTVVSGDELRARGATDLRTALELVAGVSVAPGGDLGPAGASPAMLGRREADDFLLLVDGVPAGSVFTPSFATLDLHDVERIEVLRGPAPVLYGTAAFAGTIHVIHYPAGRAARTATLAAGSFGSLAADASTVVGDGARRQSLAADATRDRIDASGSGYRRAHALYRLASDWTGADRGTWRLDADVTAQRQRPASPTPTDDTGQLTRALAPDFDQNPGDRKLDTDRYQLVGAVDARSTFGAWSATVSYARSATRAIQGFLQDGFDTLVPNATGFRQSRRIDEIFADAHLTQSLARDLAVSWGVNETYGRIAQDSLTFDYQVPLDGTGAPPSADVPATLAATMHDRRSLFGVYSQLQWKPVASFNLLAGLRWSMARDTLGAVDSEGDAARSSRSTRRGSGSLGASWRAWSDPEGDLDDIVLHASIGNTFQLAQLDLGPEGGFAPQLAPETERNVTAGIKADGADGRFDADLSWFFVDFDNQPLAGEVNGVPALVAAGRTRFRGVELESSYAIRSPLRVTASYSVEDARYRDFVDATLGQLAGNRIAMNPRRHGALGISYAPERGWQGSLAAVAEGARYLDPLNRARVGAYVTVDAMLGFRWDRLQVRLAATNLGNRRDPVLASELGDGQFYRLPARRAFLSVSAAY